MRLTVRVVTLSLAVGLVAGCGIAPGPGSSPDPGPTTPYPDGSGDPTVSPGGEPEPGWSVSPREGPGNATAREPAELTGVRSGRHETYDRVVFDFADTLPEYRFAYVDDPLRRPGSGEPVTLGGSQQLRVVLRSVDRTAGRHTTPKLPAVREIWQFPTFEATIEVGIGVATGPGDRSGTPFRVGTIDSRLYVDVAHTDRVTTPTPTPRPTVSTTPPSDPSPTPPPSASEPGQELLRVGDSGPAVQALQRELRDLDYWVGPVDGVYGPLTQQAVYALQKAAGISRDGIVGPDTRSVLAEDARPSARSDSGHVVEVDLDRQLLLVTDGEVDKIFHTSTGTFEYYTHDGQRFLADTPRGRWEISWQVNGWDPGPLGRLYRPKYFHEQGIAVHGFPEFPPYPASHGCVRVSLAAMDWLWNQDAMPIGTRVWVY